MRSKNLVHSVLILLGFGIATYGRDLLALVYTPVIPSLPLRIAYAYAWWVIPVVLITGYLYGFRALPKRLGLGKGLVRGFLFALVTVLPMLMGSAWAGRFTYPESWLLFLRSTVFAGFMEELLYRGFLFGLLFRKTQWGFIPAALVGALFFGMGHLYQGSTLAESAGIFLITALGAGWFAWLYVEWDNNLWVPIFLHILMNLSWTLFDVSENALGGGYANVFRALTIALTIILTIRYHKKQGLAITRKNLWVNAQAE